MNKITQTARYRQSLINYARKNGVSKAAVRYHTNRQYIYRWMKRYDGTLQSLEDRSRRPHSHPNQHQPEEIKLIDKMRRRNPNAGLVVFWVKLRQRGYSRSVSGLYRFLRKRGQMAIKLPNPKYIPKQYKQADYPGQKVQIDVKYVPSSCLVGTAVEDAKENGGYYYQYTFIDEYSRFRYLEALKDHNSYSASELVKRCVKRFPYAIECVQTDNGMEFTNRLNPQYSDKKTLFELTLEKLHYSTNSSSPIRPDTMEKLSAATEKTMNTSTPHINSFPLMTIGHSLLSGSVNTTNSLCVHSIGKLLNRSYLISLMCNTSLTNLHILYLIEEYENA